MIISGSIAVGILLILSVLLGLAGRKQWKTFDEYLVGKRDMGPIITGAALSATYISGWAFCGSTGIVYALGFSGMWFAGIWSLVGIIPCIWLGALKTRDFSKKLGAATLPETIGRRFESKGLQTVVAISMLFFLFLYSVGQLKAGATVWFAMTGLSPLWCLLLSVFIAWLYMVLGGYVGNQYAMALQGLVFCIVGTVLGVWAFIVGAVSIILPPVSRRRTRTSCSLSTPSSRSSGLRSSCRAGSVSLPRRSSSSPWQSAFRTT